MDVREAKVDESIPPAACCRELDASSPVRPHPTRWALELEVNRSISRGFSASSSTIRMVGRLPPPAPQPRRRKTPRARSGGGAGAAERTKLGASGPSPALRATIVPPWNSDETSEPAPGPMAQPPRGARPCANLARLDGGGERDRNTRSGRLGAGDNALAGKSRHRWMTASVPDRRAGRRFAPDRRVFFVFSFFLFFFWALGEEGDSRLLEHARDRP